MSLSLRCLTIAGLAVALAMGWPGRVTAGDLRLTYGEIEALAERMFSRRTLSLVCGTSGGCSAREEVHRVAVSSWPEGVVWGRLAAPGIVLEGSGGHIRPRLPLRFRVEVARRNGGLAVDVRALAARVAFHVDCGPGQCGALAGVAQVSWHGAGLSVHLGGRSSDGELEVTGFALRGTFSIACAPGWDLAALGCGLVRGLISPWIGERVRAWGGAVVGRINRAGLAQVLSGLLGSQEAGAAGAEVGWQIGAIGADGDGVRVSFCLVRDCGRVNSADPRR